MPTFAERLAAPAAAPSLLIGVIHLPPLPGSPRWPLSGASFDQVLGRAWEDAEAYAENGADAVIVENFGDAPFSPGTVSPETVAAMAVAGQAVRTALAGRAALGFNVLRNDARAALALCAACGGEFLRVNVLTGAAWTDQGLIQGDAHGLLRARRVLAPEVTILADVHVKHAHPAPGAANLPIGEAARDTVERGLADGLIVSGVGTGAATDPGDVERVRRACPSTPVFVGSGVSPENVRDLLARGARGVIVGSALMRDGRAGQPVEPARVQGLTRVLRA